jgi:uncharacterized membrane protein YeaQ/YmgE (transglycosylase-associated protein family)
MKRIMASAVVWAGLWAVGMTLYGLKALEGSRWEGGRFFLTPLILAAATVAWGIVGTIARRPGKGCSGAFAGMMLGIVYGTGAFFGSILLRVLLLAAGLRGDGCMAERIAWLIAGGIVGAIAGACLERDRQRMFEPAGSRT